MTFELREDLRPLSRSLTGRGIPHRISEQGGKQVVWVTTAEYAEAVNLAHAELLRDGEQASAPATPARGQRRRYPSIMPRLGMRQAPWIATLMLASAIATLLLNGQSGAEAYAWLRMGSPAYIMESHEYWRLFTPILMHFSTLHLVFNLLMLWVFGQQIESREGSFMTLVITLLIALISNLAQYWMTGSNFGGMSGVVYGVLAYCWLWDRLNPTRSYDFPPALMGFMLVWLALGFTNLPQSFGFGRMANAAHLLGLVAGLALVPAMLALHALKRRNQK